MPQLSTIAMLYLDQTGHKENGLPSTHFRGGDCSTSVVDPSVNSYTQTKPPLVPTHRVGNERSTIQITCSVAFVIKNSMK